MAFVQAQLANRDFTAERGHVIVVSDGTVTAKDRERSLNQRREAEDRNAHRSLPLPSSIFEKRISLLSPALN